MLFALLITCGLASDLNQNFNKISSGVINNKYTITAIILVLIISFINISFSPHEFACLTTEK